MKNLIILLFIIAVTQAQAQDGYTSSPYAVEQQTNLSERNRVIYHQQQYLYRQGQSLYFIRMDLEWPRFLSYSPMTVLQRYLTREIFGVESESMETAREQYLATKGERLDRVPDEEGLHSYYIFLSVNEMEYIPNRYVSLRVISRTEPKDTAEQVVESHKLITYDIVGDQLLTTRDLLQKSAQHTDRELGIELAKLLLMRTDTDDPQWVIDCFPGEMCLMRAGAYYDLNLYQGNDDYHALTIILNDELQHFINKKTKQMLKAEVADRQPVPVAYRPWYADTAQVFSVAEQMPSFRGSNEELYKYLSDNCQYPPIEEALGIDGRVVVQFVVEKDGNISSPTVVAPVSPGLDREAVRLVMAMPRWQPALRDGLPVRTIVSLPIGFAK